MKRYKQRKFEVEKWLKRYTNVGREIAIHKDEILKYQTRLERCTISYDGVRTSGGTRQGLDKEAYQDLIDAEKRIVERLVRRKEEVEDFISKIEDEKYRTVLTLHYVQGHDWSYISDVINYSKNYSSGELRVKALEAAEFLYQKSKRPL